MNKIDYIEYPLPYPHSEYIECVWIYSNQFEENTQNTHFWLTSSTFDLVFNLGESYKRINIFDQNKSYSVINNALIGQMKESVQIQLEQNSKVVGIRFKSNGLHQFLKIPIKEITGQTIELTSILGNYAIELE
jgi:hypothetical protein